MSRIDDGATVTSRATERGVIVVDDLTFAYPGTDRHVLSRVDMQVHEREIVCLVGRSGCGKSTLLNLVAGFLDDPHGAVTVDRRPVDGPGSDRVMVFQEDAIHPWFTVRRNVEYGLRIAGVPTQERRERSDELLDMVDLRDWADAYPKSLSGGMRKRCDMARALAVRPRVLLMDEPFAALDVLTKERMQDSFLQLWERHPMTVLFVTHDLEEALVVGDRVVILQPSGNGEPSLLDVPFPRPRSTSLKESPEFQALRVRLGREIGGHGDD